MKAPSRFLQAAVALAHETGEILLKFYRGRFRVGKKADGSVLTDAHLAAHHFLTESLEGFYGRYPILSEFSPLPSLAERQTWETYWLIDPLDGGEQFAARQAGYTVNIALIHQNKPVLGVVYAPALALCYFAAEGCGAFRQQGEAEPVALTLPFPPDYSVQPQDNLVEAFLHSSSTLQFCQIADGQRESYSCPAPSYEWDSAAAQCIVEVAGGSVTNLQGQTLRYNLSQDFINPSFVSFGDHADEFSETLPLFEKPMTPAPTELLLSVVDLAIKAGEKIMEIYGSEFRVGLKADDSPLTAADLASHHCLSEGLQTLAGQYPVLSEESALLPFEERQQWETYWLIDPLDGTKEFIKRNGEFTVNIALIRNHQPVLGVVYAPALDTSYFAEVDVGAFKKQGDNPITPIAVRKPPQSPLTVVGSRSHGGEELEGYLVHLGEHELKPIGSSLKFCLVAEGEADLYPRFGPTSEWDTAAAQCVVEVAGGSVVDLQGEPLRYNTKASLLNSYFVVVGDTTKDYLACIQETDRQP